MENSQASNIKETKDSAGVNQPHTETGAPPAKKRRKKVTLADVAADCGLSVNIVYRALIGSRQISAASREKALEAIERLGYVAKEEKQDKDGRKRAAGKTGKQDKTGGSEKPKIR